MNIEIKGTYKKGFEKVIEVFKSHFDQGLELGASFCARMNGEDIINIYAGYADKQKTKPWEADSLPQYFSASKPIAAMTIALLHDRGYLNINDKISKLWPEFIVHGKDVTIAEAISHQAGVVGFTNEIDQKMWLDLDKSAEEIAKLEPLWEPTTRSGYHPLTFGYIANEIVQRVTFQTLGDFFASEIAEPLGLDFHFGLSEELLPRHVEFVSPREFPRLGEITPIKRAAFMTKWSYPPRTGKEALAAQIPSTNGFGTAEAVATLYGLFADNGIINGTRILSPSTMEEFTKSRIKNRDLVLDLNVNWAFGIMINDELIFGPVKETLGHSGRGGSCGFGDPINNLSASYVGNQHAAVIVGGKKAEALIQALYECL